MDIEAIKKATTVSYCKEYHYFMAKSDLCLQVIGTGDTAEEALQMQDAFLQEAYQGFLQGCFTPEVKRRGPKAGTPGRPVNLRLQEADIAFMKTLAKERGVPMTKVFHEILTFYRQHQPA